jgi:hypothetical protein
VTSRLSLYNDALLLVGERSLDTLNDNVEPRRLLDQAWNSDAVNACLEEAQWQFAMRTVQIDYDPGITPPFGYQYAFDKPTDWVLTSAVSNDEFFTTPVTRYVDEAGFWYCDINPLYVRYVSNDSSYGSDMSKWPRSFSDFVAAHLATKIVLKLTKDDGKLALFINPQNPQHSIRGRALLNAKSRCAMSGPVQFPATGDWSRSRTRGSNRGDHGNTSGDLY